MRNFATNPARKIVHAAVKAVRNDMTRSTVQLTGNALPTIGTTAGVDDDGNVITVHPLIWDMDNWNDAGSVWL